MGRLLNIASLCSDKKAMFTEPEQHAACHWLHPSAEASDSRHSAKQRYDAGCPCCSWCLSLQELQTKEIKNGRLAMIAFAGGSTVGSPCFTDLLSGSCSSRKQQLCSGTCWKHVVAVQVHCPSAADTCLHKHQDTP
jgi:hypothetical protein